jgi:hypothetical protein
MGVLHESSFALLLGAVSICDAVQNAQARSQTPQIQRDVIKTDVCELAASPDKYDGKLVRVEAYISRGFEDSTLHDPQCPEEGLINRRRSDAIEPHIWAEFADDVDYWHVTGFAPLVRNDQLKRLQEALQERAPKHQMTSAGMIGTFYAGKPMKFNGRVTPLRGFGHLGCCCLFVISQVESVQTNDENLDYSWAEWNIGLPEGCYSERMLGLPLNKTIRQWQETANTGADEWRFDPREVAQDQLKELKSGQLGQQKGGETRLLVPKKSELKPPSNLQPTGTLLEASSTPYLTRFEYIESDRTTRFVIVVARPYWLQTLAGPKGVIWVPVGSSVANCVSQSARSKKH